MSATNITQQLDPQLDLQLNLQLNQYRDTKTPFALHPADSDSNAVTAQLAQAYLDYYQLDFSQDIPGIRWSGGWKDYQANGQSYSIFCQCWQPAESKATVFLVHGYFDHTGLYRHLIKFYLQQGFTVFAHDLPGHGLSSGAPANIDEFSTYTQVLRACLDDGKTLQLPMPWHLAGQSTGGAIITDLLVREGCTKVDYPLDKVMLLAPLVRPRMTAFEKLQFLLVHRFIKKTPRSRSINSHDQNFLNFLGEDPLQSKFLPLAWVSAMNRWIRAIEAIQKPADFEVLIVQGQEDGTVNWEHNMDVMNRLYKKADVFYLPEGRHHLANESEDIRQVFLNWLKEKLV